MLTRDRLRFALIRRHCGAFAEVVQAAVNPQTGQFFLGAVLRQAAVQRREIDLIHLLVLVEAGKDDGFGASHRIAVHLQAQSPENEKQL